MINPMKHLGFLIFCLLLTAAATGQERETLWLSGMSSTSNSWGPFQDFYKGLSPFNTGPTYQFNDLNTALYNPGNGSDAAVSATQQMIQGEQDVLGIAHDYGGVVLRKLQLQAPEISAMILVGVPNNGSRGIELMIDGTNGDLSSAQKLVDQIQEFREVNDCEFCDVADSFERWIQDVNGNNVEAFSELKQNPEHPTVTFLKNNPPTRPTAILWGNIDEDFQISSMMSSVAFPASQEDFVTECVEDARRRARALAKGGEQKNVVGSVFGFLGKIGKEVANIIKSSDGSLVGGIINIVGAAGSALFGEIEDNTERDTELARILRCQLADQMLEGQWEAMLLEGEEGIILEEVPLSDITELERCVRDCEVRQAWGELPDDLDCENDYCAGLPDTPELGTVFVATPHDGLLTKHEQTIDGIEPTFEMKGVNHFQEVEQGVAEVRNTFEPLFNGEYGEAFRLPN